MLARDFVTVDWQGARTEAQAKIILLMRIEAPQRQRIAEICRRYRVRKLSLFGSAAMGAERPDSDVDVLVEFIPGQAPGAFSLVDMQGELQEVFDGRYVDLVFPSILQNPWRRQAIEPQLQTIYQ